MEDFSEKEKVEKFGEAPTRVRLQSVGLQARHGVWRAQLGISTRRMAV